MSLPGVYPAKTKSGKKYYRSSLTCRGKHISLGSYHTEKKASAAYQEGRRILSDSSFSVHDHHPELSLSHEKYVSLINLRDHQIYFSNPIYLERNFFYYFLSHEIVLKFDLDDLFYYSSHKIMSRSRHLFVDDYGSQISLPSRYGIRNYAVRNRDYRFVNDDPHDFRYQNIQIFNPYYGIRSVQKKHRTFYQARIHIHGYYLVGEYGTAVEAAVAYNKAVDILKKKGSCKNYALNYIEELSPSQYADLYTRLELSPKLLALTLQNSQPD